MPGPFTHIYSARRMADFLVAQGEQGFVRPGDGLLAADQAPVLPLMTAMQAGTLMQKWEKFAALGGIGPDMFFFCMDFHDKRVPCDEIMLALAALYMTDDSQRNDWEPLLVILDTVSHPWASVLRFLIKLDKIWQQFMRAWSCTIGTITNAVGEVLDCLSGGLSTTLGNAVGQLTHDLFGVAILELVTSGDFFSFFTPVLQQGVDEQAFVWSDMLHHRKTGQMAKTWCSRRSFCAARQRRRRSNSRSSSWPTRWATSPTSALVLRRTRMSTSNTAVRSGRTRNATT